jgi:hypothetical protein
MPNSSEPDSENSKEASKKIIPPAILPLIEKPPLLKGESLLHYNDLLAALVHDVGPTDIPEWLWLIEFLDCAWEIWRNRGYRAKLIDWQFTILASGYPPQVGPAVSLVKAVPKIEAIDKILEKLQRRSDTILRQLESRRELFAFRARHAAENVLKRAGTSLPRVVAPPTVPLLPKPANESAQDQCPTDGKPIQTIPEQDSGQTPPESSEDTR